MDIKKALGVAGAATALGLVLGTTVFGPDPLAAQESTTTTTTATEEADSTKADRWLEVLQPLVEEGTLTAEQAQAVADHLAETLPGRHGHFIGRGPGLAAFSSAAAIIGIEPEELREALADGSTLAEVAEANGVSTDELVEGLVTALEEKLDELVAEGRLTEEQAAEILETAPERFENLVTSEVHVRRGFWLSPDRDPDNLDDDTDADA